MARTRKNDRSGGLDRIIRYRLAAERDTGGVQCPDASIIAAYCERSLPLDERSLWERHFAGCARCAGTIAALSRIASTVETPDSKRAADVAGDARRWWKLRGSFPILAFGATVAVLALIVIRTFTAERFPIAPRAEAESKSRQTASNTVAADGTIRPAKESRDGRSVIAMNEAVTTKPAPSFQSFAKDTRSRQKPPSKVLGELGRPPRDEIFDKETRADKLKQRNAEIANHPASTVPDSGIGGTAAGGPLARTMKSSGRADASSTGLGGSIGSARSPAYAQAPALSSPPGPIAVQGGAGNGAVPSGHAPESTSAFGTATGGASTVGAGTSASAGSGRGATSIAVEPPDHSVVWMIGEHGAISRYSHGAGWILQASGVNADLVAGSAPSASICWIVGRVGTILRTLDGFHWSKINAPVSGDLSSVVADSATDATISSADGRRFSTSDGGITWRPL